jgi:beta-galactosidase
MFLLTVPRVLRFLVPFLALSALGAAGLAAQVVASADWELPAGHLRDNGLRGDVVLNGWWELHAPAGSGKAPERVRVPDVVPTNTKPREDHRLEREFTLPEGWAQRRLRIELGAVVGQPVVRLNGVELGRVTRRFTELEIPASALRPGAQRLSVDSGWVADNVWLRSFPAAQAAVTDTYIHSSFRRMAVDLLLEGRAAPGATLRAQVEIRENPGDAAPVLAFTSEPFTADASGAWKHTASSPWANPRLWSPDTPHIYHYSVELREAASGRVVDAVLPRRFGFREVWLEPKQIVMNGVPLHFTGDSWGRTMHRDLQNREQAEATMRAFRGAGLRAVHGISGDMAFTVADEVGVMIALSNVGGLDVPVEVVAALGRDEAGDAGGDADFTGGTDEKYLASQDRLGTVIRRWREHPSILTWQIRSPWSRVTLDSTQVGLSDNPWDFWPGNNNPENNRQRYRVASRVAQFIQAIDPFRPVSAQNQPDVQVELATRYLCDNLDMQEQEMFYARWRAGESTKVLIPSEFSVPFAGHHFLRKKDHQMPQGPAYPAIHIENAARRFGDEVYLQEPAERLARFHRMVDFNHKMSPVYQRLVADNTLRTWRAWRTDGVTALAHWEMREGFETLVDGRTTAERLGVAAEVDPRRPGRSVAAGSPSSSSFPIPGVDRPLAGGEAYLRGIAGLHAYIGGAPGKSVHNKDHLFVSGARVEKRVVVLNDHFREIPLSGRWELVPAAGGGAVRSGELAAKVPAGARSLEALPIAFEAPVVERRTDYLLRVRFEAPVKGELADEFAITVFPDERAPLAQLRRKVWYVAADEAGTPDGFIAATGLRAEPLRVGGARPGVDDIVLVLRGALQPGAAGAAVLKAHDIDGLVERGLRLLVLEQSAPDVFGMRTESVRPRRVFVAAEGHPVLAGLAASDFTYWTGASDLEADVPVRNTPDLRKFPERIWHVSNENSVASRTLYRPHVGANRALLVSGFDLQETPLLETARGRGRIVFCQLDVSNRYGIDPVATRVVDNLFRYLATAERPDPARGEVTRLAARAAGVETRAAVFRAARPAGPQGWGITQAELFFREALYTKNEITRQRPDGRLPVLAGADVTVGEAGALPSVIRWNAGAARFETTLDESLFETGWARRKTAFVRGALVVNQGGSREDGPALGHHGNTRALYPHRFLEGFIDPYTAACW